MPFASRELQTPMLCFDPGQAKREPVIAKRSSRCRFDLLRSRIRLRPFRDHGGGRSVGASGKLCLDARVQSERVDLLDRDGLPRLWRLMTGLELRNARMMGDHRIGGMAVCEQDRIKREIV